MAVRITTGQTALTTLALVAIVWAQDAHKPTAPPPPTAVTVPASIDHGRVMIDVDLPLADGSMLRVKGWVNDGNPDLYLSQRVAKLAGVELACAGDICSGKPPSQIGIGGMEIPLSAVNQASVSQAQSPQKVDSAASGLAAGMAGEISIPSTVLRHYDVLIDYPGRKFTIGEPGTIHFKGIGSKIQVDENGLIGVSSKIENKTYRLALDTGSSFSFLARGLFDTLAATHPDWPRMTGAVGPANMQGANEEVTWKLMRIDRLQFGPVYLTDVAVASLAKDSFLFSSGRAGMAAAGLIGANSLMNYRIGLDYAHSTVYFDIGRTFNFPDFDVIGLILRSEHDGSFAVAGVADFDGKSSLPGVQAGDQLVAVDGIPVAGSTLGQVWSMLEGLPGQERRLTITRAGKEMAVAATVRHFLAEAEQSDAPKRKSR
jgi:hypothetical protein